MLKGQFILTTKNIGKPRIKIGNYNLYFDGELTKYEDHYLLGYAYNWEHPECTNLDILKEHFLDRCSGRFIMIREYGNDIIISNDACAQYDVFYDDKFETFASQPNLIKDLTYYKGGEPFYKTQQFLSKGYYVNKDTQYYNIKHLIANHYIKGQKVCRFFPTLKISSNQSVKDTAHKAAEMLKGYIKAASMRKRLAIPVTAGYDTRTLFGASLDIDCDYFIVKDQNMSYDHYDIQTALKLMHAYKKDYTIISSNLVDIHNVDTPLANEIKKFIDFPQQVYDNPNIFNNCQILNGNISEIARNWWGNYRRITGRLMCYLNGYKDKYVLETYKKWIKDNKELFESCNLDPIDMFYWEERHSNWCAKNNRVIWGNRDVWNPYNSRELLCLLLSVNRKHRDYYNNCLLYTSPSPRD